MGPFLHPMVIDAEVAYRTERMTTAPRVVRTHPSGAASWWRALIHRPSAASASSASATSSAADERTRTGHRFPTETAPTRRVSTQGSGDERRVSPERIEVAPTPGHTTGRWAA